VASSCAPSGVRASWGAPWVRVPQAISVVTPPDSWCVEPLAVALTAVRLPLHQLGSAAAELLIEAIDGRPSKNDVFITEPAPQLVLRRSTGPPPSRGA